MSYVAAVDHLYALGHELAPTAPGAPRRKFELAHMRILAAALGDPQRSFPAVLIAGTNGKGSTASTLASILAAAGYRTGLYTSPHLVHVNERMRVNNLEIPDDDFARLYFHVDDTAQRLVAEGRLPHPPSFFEVLTALAFTWFAERKIQIAVLEVGLGGRLDATNIVDPILSVITDISLDHQDYLGNTIAQITREKAGILRPHGTLITLPQHPEANQAIGEIAAQTPGLRAISAAEYLPITTPSAATHTRNQYTVMAAGHPLHIDSPLTGHHQQRNIALAIASAVELRNHTGNNPTAQTPPSTATSDNSNQNGYNIPDSAIEAGIRNTFWPGRLERIELADNHQLLLDVAHNPAGAWALRAALGQLPATQPRTLIFSCLRDKDLGEMTQILLPLFDRTSGDPDRAADHILFAPINSPRAAAIDELAHAATALDIPAETCASVEAALTRAEHLTPAGGIIVATGSIYLIGELRRLAIPQ